MSGPMWSVPTGGANTGLCAMPNGTLVIGDYENTQLIFADIYGANLGTLSLTGAPSGTTVQGVAYDASRSCYWVGHRDATSGTIRRYNLSGAIQQTITCGVGTWGPNGLAYDTANDQILCAWDDNKVRAYNCTSGALVETITVDSALTTGGGTIDGLSFDPSDVTKLWLSLDAVLKVGKITRSTGALVTSWTCPGSPEGIAFVDGDLYLCCDRLYHESIPGGNQVYRYTTAGLNKAIHAKGKSMAGSYR